MSDALDELAAQAQELDMGYGKGVTDERLQELIADAEVGMDQMTQKPTAYRWQRDHGLALRELARRRHREPPHCPSCSCGEHILGDGVG
jgi:hypothetical protein